jgi:hypothetical protein
MRAESILAWVLVGFCLLSIGTLLYMSGVAGNLGTFLQTIGLLYFIIGIILGVLHNNHMAERTRAGRE